MKSVRFVLKTRVPILLILGAVVASCQSPAGADPSSEFIALSTNSITFSANETERNFTIRNLKQEPVQWQVRSWSPAWVTAIPSSGSLAPGASATSVVYVDQTELREGSHTASLEIAAGGETTTLRITVEQVGKPAPGIEPHELVLAASDESGVLEIGNAGGSTLEWALTPNTSWIELEPKQGKLRPGGRTQVVVNVQRRGLPPGHYNGTVHLVSNGGRITAKIKAEVGLNPPMRLDPTSLTFGLTTQQFPLRIVNNGNMPLAWSAAPGPPWLTFSPGNGQVSPHSTGEIQVAVNRAGLRPGLHQSALQINSNRGRRFLSVSLNSAPGAIPDGPSVPQPNPTPPSPAPDPSPTPSPTPPPPSSPSAGDTTLGKIDATGKTDVTAALNAYFASVPDYSLIRLPSGARYRIEGVLVFFDRRGLTIEGNGATFFANTDGSGVAPPPQMSFAGNWPAGRKHFLFRGGGGFVIRNLTVRGAHPNGGKYVESRAFQHGFQFQGVDGVEMDNVTVTDVYGDNVILSMYPPGSGQWTRNVHIHDSHFERNGRQGITVDGGEDVLIENIYLGDVGRSSIDLEPAGSSGGARRLTVRNSTFGSGTGMWLASWGSGSNIEDITMEGNTLIGKSLGVLIRPPGTNRRRNIKILNNTSDSSSGSPIPLMRFERVDGVTVQGNTQPLSCSGGQILVRCEDCTKVDVRNNNVYGTGLASCAITELEIQ